MSAYDFFYDLFIIKNGSDTYLVTMESVQDSEPPSKETFHWFSKKSAVSRTSAKYTVNMNDRVFFFKSFEKYQRKSFT